MECLKCKKEIENTVKVCPHCGFEIDKNKKLAMGFLAGLILFFVLQIGGCVNDTVNEVENNKTQVIQTTQGIEYSINIAPEKIKQIFISDILKQGYNIKGHIYYTKSKDFESLYIFGALVEKNGQIYNCLWANNKKDLSGIYDSINEHAYNVSGIIKSGNINSTDDGVSRINQSLLKDWQ